MAVAAGILLRTYYHGPFLPRSVFAIGAAVWLAVALIRARTQPLSHGESDHRGPRLVDVLWTVGVLWLTLAVI
jgi:hypothetical protein